MKTISGKEFCKILERNGWVFYRVHGSHHVFKKQGMPMNIAVPVHGNDDLKIGLLKAMMKQAGLTEQDL
jgi:predicted RNA binding protein YcfA (HicA-like mRNA interferase family)